MPKRKRGSPVFLASLRPPNRFFAFPQPFSSSSSSPTTLCQAPLKREARPRTIDASDVETLGSSHRFLDGEMLYTKTDLLIRAGMLAQQVQQNRMVGTDDGCLERMPVQDFPNEPACCVLSVKGSCTDGDRLRHAYRFPFEWCDL
jgi:hypothetical protein